jgi:hypothetical protein
MAFDGSGSLFALGMRVTKLAANGSPLVGAENSYVTDALIQAQLGLEYEDGEEIVQRNGGGQICLTYKAPDSLKRGTITGLQICTPDPVVLSFMTGGNILENGDDQVGYQAPEVGTDPNPNGFSLELWSRAIIDGAYAGYYWWVVPRAFVRPSGEWAISGTDPLTPEFEGFSTQNPNWLDGPQNDWGYASERVWQFVRVDSLPDLSPGFRPVIADQVVGSLAIEPATVADLAVGADEQLTATATYTPSGTEVVTNATSWSSSDTAVATVSNGGVVSGVAVGTATITGTYAGQSDTSAITVV